MEANLTIYIIIFLVCSIVIAIGGSHLTKTADRIADITRLGEALVGAIFLGAVTSLPGIVTSVTAAYENHPSLSVSNAIGGIALQTLFLAIADITYTRANLEHAAASLVNILQAVLLILILSFILLINVTPEVSVWAIHPASLAIPVFYVIGQQAISKAGKTPMWNPVKTKETLIDEPKKDRLKLSLKVQLFRFIVLSALIGLSGYIMAETSIKILAITNISESIFGGLFTALSSSSPELIVSIAAVRQKALTLAVSNVIGGNTFDVLFLAFSDYAYREGSIYHTMQNGQLLIINLTIMLTAVLTLGLLSRQKEGFIRIGWESLLIVVLFIMGYLALFRIHL
ncbi:MAG TPA: sodium:calcium antiporter [Cyclobacteriaceae bacterium]